MAFTGFAPGLRLPERRRPGLNVPRRSYAAHAHPGRCRGAGGHLSAASIRRPARAAGRSSASPPRRCGTCSATCRALLQPGFRVRFVDVCGRRCVGPRRPAASRPAAARRCHRSHGRRRRWRSAAPACRPCSRTWAATARPGRACRPRAPWTRRAARRQPPGRQRQRHGLPRDRLRRPALVGRGDTVVAVTGADAPARAHQRQRRTIGAVPQATRPSRCRTATP